MHNKIKDGIKESMKAHDAVRLSVLRGILAACTNELVAKGKTPQDTLADEDVLVVIARLAKQRKDSIEQFTKGGRADLVAEETAQLAILSEFLPKMMERAEIETIAKAKQSELGATDASKKGLFMSALMKDLKGKADGADVKNVVDSLFG